MPSDTATDPVAFATQVGVSFSDTSLLETVFTHRSYLNEHRDGPREHNERLEFLGDAVLELVVTEHLYRTYPNPEGELTNWRSALVKGETLASIAESLGIPAYLRMSYGEEKSGGRQKGYLLANALEAFLGALYLDQGYLACQGFITQHILSRLPDILERKLFIDPKSRLQEYTQASLGGTPTYEVVGETGPDHAKIFEVAVSLGDRLLAVGSGNSKQAAQIAAAEAAITAITTEG